MSLTCQASSGYAALVPRSPLSRLSEPEGAAWAGFLLAHAYGLHRLCDPRSRGLGVAHTGVLWTVALVGGLQLERWTDGTLGLGSGWVYAAALAPLVVLTLGLGRLPRVFAVPVATEFEQHRALWSWSAGIVLAALWMLAHLDAGDTDPVAFIPLLNPLELLQLGLLVLALRWSLGGAERQVPVAAMGAAGFLLLTVMTLRAVHQLTGAPWSEALFDSRLAQTALTVVWSIAGVAAWIAGSRMLRRGLWLAGAILMGVVLAKLVLVDRSYVGNIAGIVSFVAVGLLLIVVGYVAPSPPRRAQEAADINPHMLVEAPILDRNECLRHIGRQRSEFDRPGVLRALDKQHIAFPIDKRDALALPRLPDVIGCRHAPGDENRERGHDRHKAGRAPARPHRRLAEIARRAPTAHALPHDHGE